MSKKRIFLIVVLIALIAGGLFAPEFEGISSTKLYVVFICLFILALLYGFWRATRRRQKEGTGLPTDLSEPGEDTRR